MIYKANVDVYRYTFQPDMSARPETMALYVDRENRKIERSIRTLADALGEVRTGTSNGSTITLSNMPVTPGTYTNPVITVRQDGRISAVRSGDEQKSPIPRFGQSGQYLASDGANGTLWKDIPTPIPAGGQSGQVLSKTATGTAWTTVETPPLPVIPSPTDSADVMVNRGGTAFSLMLRPTGVSPGTYLNPTVTCDMAGRITGISEGSFADDAVPTAFCSHTSAGTSDAWRLMVDLGFNATFDGDVAFIIDGKEVTGLQTRTGPYVSALFPAPVDVQGVRITTPSGSGMASGRVQQPDEGLWTTAFELPRQAEWTAGETRFFTIGPSVSLVGDITGTGANEIVTKLSPTGVKPGTYRNADVTVDASGRVTKIAAGQAGGGAADPNAVTDSQTWRDAVTGDILTVTVRNGAFSFTTANTVTAQDGSTLMAENGTDYISF